MGIGGNLSLLSQRRVSLWTLQAGQCPQLCYLTVKINSILWRVIYEEIGICFREMNWRRILAKTNGVHNGTVLRPNKQLDFCAEAQIISMHGDQMSPHTQSATRTKLEYKLLAAVSHEIADGLNRTTVHNEFAYVRKNRVRLRGTSGTV